MHIHPRGHSAPHGGESIWIIQFNLLLPKISIHGDRDQPIFHGLKIGGDPMRAQHLEVARLLNAVTLILNLSS